MYIWHCAGRELRAMHSPSSVPALMSEAHTERAYDDRAYALSIRKSYVPALCPVVTCPYLRTSDHAIGNGQTRRRQCIDYLYLSLYI